MKVALSVILLILSGALAPASRAQIKIAPGSAVRGEQLLTDKGCLSCHSLNGRGGSVGPDFARVAKQGESPSTLALNMWNHMPQMLNASKTQQKPFPTMTSMEAADLFAFFYSTLYFSPAGSAVRGREVFSAKNCASCHSEVLAQREPGKLTPAWTDSSDPVVWTEHMWNHASEMERATSNRGLRWPELSSNEVADLVAFLSKRDLAPNELDFSRGEPERGRNVFEASCEGCHSFGPVSGKVDLLAKPGAQSLIGYAAAMWNHAPIMRKRGGSTAKVNSGEMVDLVSYLFTQYYFSAPGNAAAGRRVFEVKGCAACHDSKDGQRVGPDLTHATEKYSPVTLTAAAWRHGPAMMSAAERARIPWPQFKGAEMRDLISYLNSNVIPLGAGPR